MSNGLAVLENLNAVEVFVAGGTDKLLQAIRDEVINDIPDTTTAKGRTEIASRAAKVSKSKVFIIKKADVLKAELKAQLKPITLETTKVENVLSALRKEVRLPLTQWEDAEKERIEELKNRLSKLDYIFANFCGWSISDIKAGLEIANNTVIDDTWQEFKVNAAEALPVFIEELTDHLNNMLKQEQFLAELERLKKEEAERKQEEREAQIAKDAAAEAEAEKVAAIAREEATKKQAAQDAKDADDRAAKLKQTNIDLAESDRRAALKKAEADKKAAVQAEQDRAAELERQKLAVIAEIDATAAKKSANRAHQKKINIAALAGLQLLPGMNEDLAKSIITAIAKGKISNITINY